jgi:hypothetical protein
VLFAPNSLQKPNSLHYMEATHAQRFEAAPDAMSLRHAGETVLRVTPLLEKQFTRDVMLFKAAGVLPNRY